jgi:hypothetical protein
MLDPRRANPDALAVVDVEPPSKTYGQMVGRADVPIAVMSSSFRRLGRVQAPASARTRLIRTFHFHLGL